jgi:hypothetical protein
MREAGSCHGGDCMKQTIFLNIVYSALQRKRRGKII